MRWTLGRPMPMIGAPTLRAMLTVGHSVSTFPSRVWCTNRFSSAPSSSTRSPRPSSRTALTALEFMVKPAPYSFSESIRSKTATSRPARRKATAAVNPPIPAPTIITLPFR